MMHLRAPLPQEWTVENLSPFDELILSWNGQRPREGAFLFSISVKIDDWSPWLPYASWGSEGQSSFQSKAEAITIDYDTLSILEKKATGFRIKISTQGTASLTELSSLHVYIHREKSSDLTPTESIALPVPGLSQMCLNHLRYRDLCSPTSTTAVIHYLLKKKSLLPLHFAKQVWDQGGDLFGNWVFNIAQASACLGSEWSCWVEKLSGFGDIYKKLHQGIPIITSVRGPLPGSAAPYATGHLLVVTGYDPLKERVLCMDPAFPSDDATHISYSLSDFMEAWERRGKVAYIFKM